jgi:hypothetical protein
MAVVLAFGVSSCSRGSSTADGGEDAGVVVIDICDAFTEVAAACPLPSSIRCFPLCEAGGCFCRPTAQGPRWECETDLSCVPDCAPVDYPCQDTGVEGDGGEGGSD